MNRVFKNKRGNERKKKNGVTERVASRRRRSEDVRNDKISGTAESCESGEHRNQQRTQDGSDYVEEEAVFKRPRVEGKTHSNFVELRRTLTTAGDVAAFISQHHDTKLRDFKHANGFFQAISNCSEHLFALFCQAHKREVHIVLERILELFSGSRVSMSPPVHEFIIRCEQNGVKKLEWAVELNSNIPITMQPATDVTTQETLIQPLLSSRELLKKLATVDLPGRMGRMIEMCTSIKDLYTCASKLQAAINSGVTSADAERSIGYAVRCKLIGKLASKARRTCGAALRSEAPHVSADDAAAVRDIFGILLDLTEDALSTHPLLAAQNPISKLAHFAKWCDGYGLLDAKHAAAVAALESRLMRGLRLQEAQLETVMTLKALPAGDEAAARGAIEKIWNAEKGHFEPYSADVLSSIAVVAGGGGMSEEFRAQVAEQLVKTYRSCLSANGGKLPRRALTFVNAEHSLKKQKSITKMLAAAKRENE